MNEMSPPQRHVAEPPPTVADLGGYVCWSRMQAEAGQGLETIIARKELERRAGNGLFLWGVGNPPSTAISALARIGCRVPVVFSVMKSRPKPIDVAPSRIFAWRRYFDPSANERPLPASAVVTSRADSAGGAKRAHYALMCHSRAPLTLSRGTPFDVSAYRNAGGTGAPVGASQVTALLKQVAEPGKTSDYEVNLVAWLAGGYWVRLSDPVEVDPAGATRLDRAAELEPRDWLELAAELRASPQATARLSGELLLF
ncbi:hypothetical protein SAMN06297144_1192 [Sphingomonas guangdongensis]|uniref:Uncharacterized protein n=1 Tax=Sphingomonas guangdongensis TaxID=1141890 RepID=A0A285QGV6_9SPHN|nr:hypothetical protein [Sphingomonas guangdongensis]SOB80694.1 hypothetical protein SAMN06297144_1192 [Sphingomonas guangdongensis]